jgi:hypothetical protein
MALNYDNLSALTRDKYIPLLVDNIFESNVLCHRMLRKSKAAASGNKVLQPLEYAKADAKGFYSGYDVLDTSPTEVFTDAEYEWKQAYATISISGKEEALNDGKERVIDLLEAKVKNAEKTIKQMFGEKLYSTANGTSDEGFMGLQHVCAVDREMGGIDSNDATEGESWWDCGHVGTGTTTYANAADPDHADNIVSDIRAAYGALTIGSDKPTLIVTSQIAFDAYEECLTAQKRFGSSSKSLADAGFTNLLYRGTPVVVDDECPPGKMFFLNEKYIGFRHHRKRNFKFEGFQKPVNQDARVAKILWLGALTVSNPRMMGVVGSLPISYS